MPSGPLDDVRDVFFIKLGRGGGWEAESIGQGIIRFGYDETPADLAELGRWNEIKDRVRGIWSSDEGALTRHVEQVRKYYEADERDVFITFHSRALWWCRATGPVERYPNGWHWRRTIGGWSNRSLGGQLLSEDKLSGNLTKVQMFRGTLSKVHQKEYLLRRLRDEDLPVVAHAKAVETQMIASNVALLKLLTWRDFELLVDLVFTSSGWRRVAEVGRTQKTVDLELMLPTTGERAFVQIKSRTGDDELQGYLEIFQQSDVHARMFYVWHSGKVDEGIGHAGVTLVGPTALAGMVMDAGLSTWLREKVA